ncbi:C40 family peptidase [Actinomadura algeriensis]|uniref:Cell wall-associated NlpC family hydrolase n=1 Tax=Actinomadura algeriensis TaxID=1679523 RepID=A0ABR9JRE9_9ACTN|nr:NlpC/P60 family protein [Actinomadura algeriensis]MBE1532953.1 cell wall-associated NlpC family hydrolase [Actinomadura algeriensis]
MEPSRPASRARRTATVAAALAVVSIAPHVAAPERGAVASADPGPSTGNLTSEAFRLADEFEKLTERYNGLRVSLEGSEKAAKVSKADAERQRAAFDALREKIGRLAATRYMQGGSDPTVTFVASQDPQAVLDRAATLNYFAKQQSTKVVQYMRAMQSAERARKAAEQRAEQVTILKKKVEAQRKKVTAEYEKIRGKVIKQAPEKLAALPVVGTGKAARALQYAMSKLGRPYVWGAAGPSTFDCSGLTMWAYAQVGIKLPHYTGSQFGSGVRVSESELQPGDLVFFHADLHHMGMYVGGGKMIHAPHTGDVVRIAPMEGRPFAGGVRVA